MSNENILKRRGFATIGRKLSFKIYAFPSLTIVRDSPQLSPKATISYQVKDITREIQASKAMAKAVSEFVRVASTNEIPEGKMRKVMVGPQQVLVVNLKGKYYAIGNVCTHFGGSLDRGILEGNEVECPLHHSHFDVTTGQVKRGPATRPEPVYDVKVESGSILVRPKQ